jgi:thiol-disulfide isomerase/thioredoxin
MMKWIYIIIVVVLLGIAGTYFYLRAHNQLPYPLKQSQSAVDDNQDLSGDRPGRVTFKNLGPAPEFKKIDKWLNGDPQTIAGLQGKVILVNFWTYSCFSCINNLPTLNQWNDKYKENGFAVVGVHTPEYVFEKNSDNVLGVIGRFQINYPVALDNAYATWNAYKNQFWPAMYLINQDGKIIYTHYGDGGIKTTEKAIRLLLGLETDPLSPLTPISDPNQVKSPTLAVGLKHLDYFANETLPDNKPKKYKLPPNLSTNTYALEGTWKLDNDKATLTAGIGKIMLKFNAAKVYMRANSKAATSLKITVDGKTQLPVTVEGLDNYTLFDSGDYGEHTIEIEVQTWPFEIDQFSFG